MSHVFWSAQDPRVGVIAQGFDRAGAMVERRLAIPGLSYAYSAASQGRGGWYNGVSRDVRVPARTRFIGESVDTGVAPITGGFDAVRAAGAAWWANVGAFPARRRTPARCFHEALSTAAEFGVEEELVRGLTNVLGADAVMALAEELPGDVPIDQAAAEAVREQLVAEGEDPSYFDSLMQYAADNRQTAADLLRSTGEGVLRGQDRALQAIEHVVDQSYETDRAETQAEQETERHRITEGEQTWREWGREAADVPKTAIEEGSKRGEQLIEQGGKTSDKGMDTATVLGIVTAITVLGVAYFATSD